MGIVDAVSESAVGKVAVLLIGDVVAFAGVAFKGVERIRAYREERRKKRATSGETQMAVELLIQAETRTREDDVPSLARQQVLIILESFGEAWGRCRAYGFSPAGLDFAAVREQFGQTLAQHWVAALAADHPDANARLAYMSRLVDDPLRTPYYKALWATLQDARWDTPLLDKQKRLTFEQFFRLAYSAALASQEGQELLRHLEGLSGQRAMIARQLIISDMAGWGARHIFGNVVQHEQLPALPLCEMYVEPLGATRKADYEPGPIGSDPLLGLTEELLREHHFVVVQAPMGHGKSLSARYLTWRLAQRYLEASQPSSECWLPVFIKCAEDLTSSLVEDWQRVARRALLRHLRELQLKIAADDDACAPPERGIATLYIFDGLDEVGLNDRDRDRLFTHLADLASPERRFLVLSRPQVVPKELLQKRKVPIVHILSLSQFNDYEMEMDYHLAREWLARWNLLIRHPEGQPLIHITEVEARGLLELAATPILLFMIAFTWDEQSAQRTSRAALYETFFRHISQGKHEQDQRAEHHAIQDAARQLLDKLVELGHLGRSALPRDAMLWLMSRAAWKAHCLSQQGYEMSRSDLEDILRTELQTRGDRDATRIICGGLLLALQADPDGENPALLFGHKSFREYMVARYWAAILRKLVAQASTDDEVRAELNKRLLEGRLLQEDDQSFSFLMDLINLDPISGSTDQLIGWSDDERRRLTEWANACFNDESILTLEGKPSLRRDRRAFLREAALAIGCAVRGGQVVARDPQTLRSLLASFWFRDQRPIIRAPGLQHPGAYLDNAWLSRAILDGANLTGAQVREATLERVSLRGATPCNAILTSAVLEHATLDDADLTEAALQGARLMFLRAQGTNFTSADLQRADCAAAHFEMANFQRADLRGAHLGSAEVEGATFQDAQCSVAAPGTKETIGTTWPPDFDPRRAGLILEEVNEDIPF